MDGTVSKSNNRAAVSKRKASGSIANWTREIARDANTQQLVKLETSKATGHIKSRCLTPIPEALNGDRMFLCKLAGALRSTLAVEQFASLVRAWRQEGPQFQPVSDESTFCQSIRFMQHWNHKSQLGSFCFRLGQILLS